MCAEGTSLPSHPLVLSKCPRVSQLSASCSLAVMACARDPESNTVTQKLRNTNLDYQVILTKYYLTFYIYNAHTCVCV